MNLELPFWRHARVGLNSLVLAIVYAYAPAPCLTSNKDLKVSRLWGFKIWAVDSPNLIAQSLASHKFGTWESQLDKKLTVQFYSPASLVSIEPTMAYRAGEPTQAGGFCASSGKRVELCCKMLKLLGTSLVYPFEAFHKQMNPVQKLSIRKSKHCFFIEAEQILENCGKLLAG